jgi:non-ribosomal peptide synthetase component F
VPGRELDLHVQFRADVFDEADIETLIERFQQALVAMTTDPARRLSSTDVPDGGKRARPDRPSTHTPLAQPAPTAVAEYHPNGHHAPPTLVEQILTGIYTQVLGVDRVGVDESFFDLGGDSLAAMRAIAAINTALDTHLALTTLFEAPSVTHLSQRLDPDAHSEEEIPAVSPTSDP